MTLRPALLAVGITAALTLVAGCSGPSDNAASLPRPAAVDAAMIAKADAQISQPGWLIARLPDHTAAYVRIPSLWGTLSAPDGRPLDAALAADAHAKIVASLRKAIQNDSELAQTQAGPALQLLLGDQAGPLEVAVLDSSDGVTPFSRALVSVPLDIADVAALNARIATLSAAAGGVSPLQAPVDSNGDAALQKFGALHFDAASHRLFLSLGATASAMTLSQDMASTKDAHSSPVQAVDKEIDSSGQGLFAWMSLKGMTGPMDEQLRDQPADGLLRDALAHAQSIALGWGTVDGHGRLQIQVRAPNARLLGYLAPDAGTIDLKTSGRPRWVFTMALPSPNNLQAIHDGLDRDFGAGTRAAVDALLGKAQAHTGVDPLAFEKLFGPQVVAFGDANGTFSAVRVRDRKALDAQLADLAKRPGWKLDTVNVEGTQIHHLQIPSLLAGRTPAGDADAQAVQRVFSRIDSHLYWVDDGDWLVLATVPQALADRAAAHPAVPLGDWLKQSQGYDAAHTLLGFGATTHDMQRDVYYAYLHLLQIAGDALGQPADIAALPSASKLKLPVEGAMGMALQANDQRIGLQMTYEQSPIEVLAQGNATGAVAVVAIMAAIAIPAYQDYTIRVQASEGAILAEGSKTAVAEYYANTGTMPADNAQAGVAAPSSINGNYVSSVQIDNGRIVVSYGNQANPRLTGGALVFKPEPQGGSVRWTCDSQAGSTIPAKYRPTRCRP